MKKWIIIIVISIVITQGIMGGLYIQFIPQLKEYGKLEIERFNQLIISHCYFTKESQYENLVIIERGEDKDIKLIDFDMIKLNEIATHIVQDIENTYSAIEEGTYLARDESYYERRVQSVSQNGIISKIPIFTLLNIPIFPSLSPTIPVRYKHLSSVSSSILKNVSNYGVNHIYIELGIEISMNITMVYPFFEQYHTHTIKIPVLLEIFEGQVPLVYNQ